MKGKSAPPKSLKEQIKSLLETIRKFIANIIPVTYLYGFDKGTKDLLNLIPEQHKPKKSATRLIFTVIGGIIGGLLPTFWHKYREWGYDVVKPWAVGSTEATIRSYYVPAFSAFALMSGFAFVIKHGIRSGFLFLMQKENRGLTNSAFTALTGVQIAKIFENNPRLKLLVNPKELHLMHEHLLSLIEEAKKDADSPINALDPKRIKLARELLLQGNIEEYNRIRKLAETCIQIKAQEVKKVHDHIQYIQKYNDAMSAIHEAFNDNTHRNPDLVASKIDTIKELKEEAKKRYERQVKLLGKQLSTHKIGDEDLYQSFILEQNFYDDQIQKIKEITKASDSDESSSKSSDSSESQPKASTSDDKLVRKVLHAPFLLVDWLIKFRRKKTLRQNSESILHEIEKLPENKFSDIVGQGKKLHVGTTLEELIEAKKGESKQKAKEADKAKPVYKGDKRGTYSPMSIWADSHDLASASDSDSSDSSSSSSNDEYSATSATHDTKTNLNSDMQSFHSAHHLEQGNLPRIPSLQPMFNTGIGGGGGMLPSRPHSPRTVVKPTPRRRQTRFVNHVL